MGRLSIINRSTAIAIINCNVTGVTGVTLSSVSGYTVTTTNETTITPVNLGVYSFIDEHGNVTQIKKITKYRLKYCIDPTLPQDELINYCVIGVNDPDFGDCSDGTALGIGDTLMAYAIYN